jgi:hypothetical protein
MKSILSLAFALVALFSVSTAVAQNPHFNNKNSPTVTVTKYCDGNSSYFIVRAEGTVYGLGTIRRAFAHLDYSYTADFNCYNRGADSGPVPGQSGATGSSDDQPVTVRSGSAAFNLFFTIRAGCKGNALRSDVINLDLTELELVVANQTATPSLLSYWNGVIINGSTTCQ